MIIIAVITVIALVIFFWKMEKPIGAFHLSLSTLVILAGVMLGSLLAFPLGLIIDESTTKTSITQLHGMNSQVVPSGSLFLGSGTVSGEIVYTYWYVDGDTYHQATLKARDADDVSFKEENRTDGYLETTLKGCGDTHGDNFGFGLWTMCELKKHTPFTFPKDQSILTIVFNNTTTRQSDAYRTAFFCAQKILRKKKLLLPSPTWQQVGIRC